jgi:hypothetical protein
MDYRHGMKSLKRELRGRRLNESQNRRNFPPVLAERPGFSGESLNS